MGWEIWRLTFGSLELSYDLIMLKKDIVLIENPIYKQLQLNWKHFFAHTIFLRSWIRC